MAEAEGRVGPPQDRAALADARKRAERLAALSHAKLGQLVAVSEATSNSYLSLFTQQRCGVDTSAPALLDYQAGAATADKMTVSATLEVTFALEHLRIALPPSSPGAAQA